jgi:hypothetical protein
MSQSFLSVTKVWYCQKLVNLLASSLSHKRTDAKHHSFGPLSVSHSPELRALTQLAIRTALYHLSVSHQARRPLYDVPVNHMELNAQAWSHAIPTYGRTKIRLTF